LVADLHLEKVASVVADVKVKRHEQVRRYTLSSKVDKLLFTCVFQNFVAVHFLRRLNLSHFNSEMFKNSQMQGIRKSLSILSSLLDMSVVKNHV
jgi:hypothetical protein